MKPNDSSLVQADMRRNDMLSSVTPFDPARRGYHAVYRENEINRCPGCGRTHWLVGRTLAECGFCSTALPLSESFRQPASAVFISRSGGQPNQAFAA
ncbi:hypothetical protein FMM02_08695 [Sphingomonas xanthus]|uniref:Uncharacterized protein n=1 Tax=Sphingomonas xanthus TaxID=2594473 RepID=A0A516IT38_9SPHN|nr:hypothetical protein FMM02_08695 [Sphingomonas xanthus]